ncbi:hypothetical protein K458DRAFT_181739 [Lentithecium fluviatile CBS 122367]|uniref:Uncharacterized protein n=1 Tax=Lentithecium fluviatile CBS 122367 TaxID=1168545 RepID=A0A6G1IED5_9PLEO|nr:hypothetical protein K458DRAFT_181739 [Lentithecium fluviatile CBS 122367]
MPPQPAFGDPEKPENISKYRALLRLALCWGLHYDHKEFSSMLQEYGIFSKRGEVKKGIIRNALVAVLGKHWHKLLPADTIAQGKSTIFEVRMRILKHESEQLRDAVMDMRDLLAAFELDNDDGVFINSIDGAFDASDPQSWIQDSRRRIHPFLESSMETGPFRPQAKNGMIGGDTSVEADLCLLIGDKLGDDMTEERRETFITPSSVQADQFYSPGPVDWPQTNRRYSPLWEPAKAPSKRQPREGRKNGVSDSVSRRAESIRKLSAWKRGRMNRPLMTQEACQRISQFFPPYRLPMDCHEKFNAVRGVRWMHLIRETVILPKVFCTQASLCDDCGIYRDLYDRGTTILIHNEEALPSKWQDRFGNTKCHYFASYLTADSDDTRLYRSLGNSKIRWCLNDAAQSWLFALDPASLNHSIKALRKVLNSCRKEDFFQKPSNDYLSNQDCHGQTWLHQYLYHGDWLPMERFVETESTLPNGILRLCEDYNINPCVRDNMNRTVIQFLWEHKGNGPSDIGVSDMLRELKYTSPAPELASWNYSYQRVRCWTTWFREAGAANSGDCLDGIRMSLNGLDFETLRSYDQSGDTLLLAFISYVNSARSENTMSARNVQDTLKAILHNSPRADMRNRKGQTPLHLATALALPHIVATIILHIGSSPATGPKKVVKSIAVESYDGTSLLTDLRSTYWKARNLENALLLEADAMVCACLVTNAVAGILPDGNHEFRPFMQFYSESKKREIDGSSLEKGRQVKHRLK